MAARLRDRIAAEGALPFAEFMAEALYHPDWGYYSDPARTRVGRGGDFITSVSVGATFGRLLALRLHAFWEANGSPDVFHLLEPGPESGDLALDLLSAARALGPGFREALHYHALEPLPAKHTALEERFRRSGEPRMQVHASAGGLDLPFGAVIANEVLDALPVHVIEWCDGEWVEARVTAAGDRFGWTAAPVGDGPLRAALPALVPDDGPYRTEVCLGTERFLAPLAAAVGAGLFLFIDYGHTEADYYAPGRRTGTLRSYHRHRATDDPLHAPGAQDLTAHANFSRVAGAARSLGLVPGGFCRQERYLTALADRCFAGLEPGTADFDSAVRQFRTLTHPSLLGGSFHMLECVGGGAVAETTPFRFEPEGLSLL